MEYDVVIATKNRSRALALSLPLILLQTRKPNRLIIIDASDNHEAVKSHINSMVKDTNTEIIIKQSQPNSAYQRSIGLEYVKSPVVMFPDDDSLWWPGVAETIMNIYDRDKASVIGGVSANISKEPPPGAFPGHSNDHIRMLFKDRLRLKLAGFRHMIDTTLGSDPMYELGRSFWEKHTIPNWLCDYNATPIEYMAGCRMSFRTEAIRPVGFNEDLGSHIGWAAFEDAEASFAVAQTHLLVHAPDALVCHYTFPSPRANGYDLGFINHFNRSFIICKYSHPGTPCRSSLKRFAYCKAAQYALSISSHFVRQRLRGHFRAIK